MEIRPATPDRWDDLVSVFGRRGRDDSWCWCRRFLRPLNTESQPGAEEPNNQDALHQEINAAKIPPGLIAYLDGRPAGWTRVGPRSEFPAVLTNRALARVLDANEPEVWWVTCFAVDSKTRRTGVGQALLAGAVDFADGHGASAVEGHPVDVAALKAKQVSGSAVFTGTKAMFTAASFVEVARTAPTRPVMRRVLGSRASSA